MPKKHLTREEWALLKRNIKHKHKQAKKTEDESKATSPTNSSANSTIRVSRQKARQYRVKKVCN